jgi:hypothetical protein
MDVKGEDWERLETHLVPFSRGPRSCLGKKYVYAPTPSYVLTGVL